MFAPSHPRATRSGLRRGLARAAAMLGLAAALLFVGGAPARAQTNYASPPYKVDTFAGYAGSGSADGTGPAATFNAPAGLALDAAGNAYVADTANSTIRRVTPAGVVTTLAGGAGVDGIADGGGATARFNRPLGLVAAADGTLYVADTNNHLIRKITPAGEVSTLAGAPGQAGSTDATGAAARFKNPVALALDAAAGRLYVADSGNHVIRQITLPGGVVTTLAGTAAATGATVNGSGGAAAFNTPVGLALSADGATLHVAELAGHVIRRVDVATRAVTTLAGLAGVAGSADGSGGAGGTARFDQPRGLALDAAGNLYVAEENGCRIRRVSTGGVVTTLAGAYASAGSVDATGGAARFNQPSALAYDAAGARLLVADTLNSQIRLLDPATNAVGTLAGPRPPFGLSADDGTGVAARFDFPRDLARDAAGNLYVADRDNHLLRKITPAGVVTTLAGAAGQAGAVDGTGSAARFNQPAGVAVTADGSVIYVADSGSHTLRRVTAAGEVTTLAGAAGLSGFVNGTGAAARFDEPFGLALDASGNVHVADRSNHAIRRVTPAGAVTTLAGSGAMGSANGTGAAAEFFWPTGLAFDASGNLYVADSYNQTIRRVTSGGVVSTFAGAAGQVGSLDADTATAARFFYPYDVAVDGSGNVYVADYANHLVRRITSAGVVRTLAGTVASSGAADGIGNAARFRNPQALVAASDGTLFVADTANDTVRRAIPLPPPVVTSATTAGGTVGVAFSGYVITGSNGPSSFAASGLPAGLSVNASTGVISGTPAQAGVFSATISASNVAGTGTAALTLTVAKGTAGIAFDPISLSTPYDGTAKSVVIATTPPGLTVNVTYDGAATPPSAYGSHAVVATIADANYAGAASTTLQITEPVAWIVSTPAAAGYTAEGLALAADGTLYLADPVAHVIRRRTAAGVETVFAGAVGQGGYVDATGAAARFFEPRALALAADGTLYVADTGNHTIRRITPAGEVTRVAGSGDPDDFDAADGTGAAARFFLPMGLVLAADGALLVADTGNGVLRRIQLSNNSVQTLAPAGVVLEQPRGLAAAADGTVYVSDQSRHRLWKIAAGYASGAAFAGSGLGIAGALDGTGGNARFNTPRGLALAADGALFVADAGNHLLRRVSPAGEVTTLAGLAATSGTSDGLGAGARFHTPSALAVTGAGAVYMADAGSARLRLAAPPPVFPVFTSASTWLLQEGSGAPAFAVAATGSPTSYGASGLPAGLVIDAATGAISGTPVSSGVYPVTLSATNLLGTATATLTVTVQAPTWEAWRAAFFTSGELAQTAVSGPAADPDGDGAGNAIEYLQGSHPRQADPALNFTLLGDGRLQVELARLRALPGAWTLTPEVSTDLLTWHQGVSHVEIGSPLPVDTRFELVQIRSVQNVSNVGRLFLRLRVQLVP